MPEHRPPTPPEFSRPFRVDTIKPTGSHETGTASDDERRKLAARFGVNALESLSFACDLTPWKKGGAAVACQITAKIRQTCVVTLEEFESDLDLTVTRYFTHKPAASGPDTVLDLEALESDLPDEIVDGQIDLGELVAQELVLSIDQHPRKPGAVFSDHIESLAAQTGQDKRPNPFDALKVLKGGRNAD